MLKQHKINRRMALSTAQVVLFLALIPAILGAFNDYNSEKVLLSDVKALTLHQGQMTNARRSPPVPQLKCVGGSAQHKFQPKVVRCINSGSDGYDIQWECKTDMDNAYRFGHVEVTCEGYDYPNDPYVLKGSCGLEYTIEFTEEGLEREKQKGSYYPYQTSYQHKQEGGIGGLFIFAAILFAMYVLYKTCLAPQVMTQGAQQPPPYGFREEFMPRGPPPTYESTQQSSSSFPGGSAYAHASAPQPDNAGGFWTGAATGGLLGYLFGRGGNNYYYPNRGYRGNTWFGNGGWGGAPTHHHHDSGTNFSGSFFSSSSSSGSRSSSPSSGTRTASGFGGTSRR